MEVGEISVRPLSMRSFRRDLDKFERYIAKITMKESDASVDEKRQRINGRHVFYSSPGDRIKPGFSNTSTSFEARIRYVDQHYYNICPRFDMLLSYVECDPSCAVLVIGL